MQPGNGFSRGTPRLDGPFHRRTGQRSLIKSVLRPLGRVSAWARRLGWKRVILRSLSLGTLLGLCYFLFLWFTLPSLDSPGSLLADQSSIIVDRNGTELYRLFAAEDRTEISQNAISPFIKQAIVAIEDERFYQRGCMDVKALARAVLRLGQAGGASTLTRQLARNALNLQQDYVVNRKLKELILGCVLERKYSKDDLLALYLNWIPFGQSAYGVEQASKRFFGHSASGVSLAEAAVLASLPQRPTYFSPYGRNVRTRVSDDVLLGIRAGTIRSAADIPDDQVTIGLLGNTVGTGAALVYIGGRSDQVLKNMEEQHFITEKQRQGTIEELKSMTFAPARDNIRAPHFVLWVREQAEELLEDTSDKGILEQGGLTIETTLDWELQRIAEEAVASRSADTLKRFGAHNMALVAMDPRSREILSYVGNVAYNEGEHGMKVDMAQSPRQPGSSFKPFVYTAAFLQGYSPATVIYDVPTKFGTDEPQNFDGTFWGLTTIRRALAGSRNIPAIKGYFLAGEEEPILNLTSSIGVTTPRSRKEELRRTRPDFDYGWPLALGAAETPLIEMVEGYSTLADGGMYKPWSAIRRITRKLPDGREVLIYEAEESEGVQAVDPRIAYQITSILSDAPARPDDFWRQALTLPGFSAAAKTGTSNKCIERVRKDDPTSACRIRKPDNLWTIGFTPELAAGVWVGNANSAPLSDTADGLNVAAPVWREYMTKALQEMNAPQTSFKEPPGLVQMQVSLLSGELPTPCTPIHMRKSDLFLSDRAPATEDSACATLTVDKVTGLLASANCPAEARETRSFLVPKSLMAERWPEWQKSVLAWAVRAGTGSPLPLAPMEECDVSLTPERLIQPSVRFTFPADGQEVPYPSFQPKVSSKVGSRIKEISYTIDGKQVAKASAAPFKPVIRVPKSIDKDGSHVLHVTLTDTFFNTATDSVTIRFGEDTGAPDVSFLSPRDGLVVKNGTGLLLHVDATDNEGGIKYVEFYIDDLLLTRKPRDPFAFTYALIVTPGVHRLRAVATDLAGQTGEDSVEITVEP